MLRGHALVGNSTEGSVVKVSSFSLCILWDRVCKGVLINILESASIYTESGTYTLVIKWYFLLENNDSFNKMITIFGNQSVDFGFEPEI